MQPKRYLLLLFLLLIFVFNSSLKAQVVFVPLNDNVYDFLEELEIKGLTNRCFLGSKPLSRKQVLNYLLKAAQRPNFKNLSQLEKNKYEKYLKKLSPEKKLWHDTDDFMNIGEEIIKKLTDYEIDISVTKEDTTWHSYSLPFEFYRNKSYLQLNPIAKAKYVINSSDSSYFDENESLLTGGGRIFGYLGDHIGFGFRAVNNRVDANEFDFKKLNTSQQGIGSLVTRGTYFDEIDAYISLSSEYTDLVLGKFSNYWGSGKSGSVTISNRAPSYPQIMLRTGFSDWLNFVYFHGWLESNLQDDSTSYTFQNGDQTFYRKFYKQKYIAAHRLEIAPWDNFKFAFSEMLYYGETDPKMIYFIPVMFFWSAQHQTNDQDNEEIGFDIEWIPTDFCKLYGSMIIDDIRLTKIFDEDESLNYLGYQVGTKLIEPILSNLNMQIEYTHINPWVYTHKFPINRATSDDYLMGYWSGQNSDNLFMEMNYDIDAWQNISLAFSHYRKGAQDSTYKQYECPPSEKFMFGHQYTRNSINLQYTRELFNHLTTSVGLKYQNINVNEENIEKAEQGIYVNPVYYKNDFERYSASISISYGL